jgi:hypothetical protein
VTVCKVGRNLLDADMWGKSQRSMARTGNFGLSTISQRSVGFLETTSC